MIFLLQQYQQRYLSPPSARLSVCQTVFTFGVKYVFEFVVDTFYITHNF